MEKDSYREVRSGVWCWGRCNINEEEKTYIAQGEASNSNAIKDDHYTAQNACVYASSLHLRLFEYREDL